ncbi:MULTISPECIES: flagellar hook-basal body complex protein [Anoxybacillus]|nr:flagellar hook-basal body complex protein [Anoxybacillus flavithermus]ASA96196.1 flagellar biosynthesis protein FlgE [Anoxybacillus flavithermus]ELK21660.1 flagellar hook protein FlgE [Anoxybacillus flavithermus TNO-09.006]MBE2904084.1 flagellar hook-basal body complex protein [Anoxybacillus flavithermus]MBE2906642.1 flagellar hook-basal body complex protein [Anoxybacillus flavithermus]MBE2910057.1 flagellar hook-basal body complex protein [Anoxybacillus flavithermus]
MLRSMFTGIGGIRNFQYKLDVIGNNISNVNTYGYKKARVTFKDLVSQQISAATSSTGTRGGINGKQIGLGSGLGSIETIHTQGSTQTTARPLDLAIGGDGFFVVGSINDVTLISMDGPAGKLGTNKVNTGVPIDRVFNLSFTRAGNFYLDEYGYVVNADGQYLIGEAAIKTLPSDKNLTQVNNLRTQLDNFVNGRDGLVNFVQNWKNNFDPSSSFTNFNKFIGDFNKQIDVMNESVRNFNDAVSPKANINNMTKIPNNGWPNTLDQAEKMMGPYLEQISGFVESVQQVLQDYSEPKYGNVTSFEPGLIQIPKTAKSFGITADGKVTFIDSNGQLKIAGQILLAQFPNPTGLEKMGGNTFKETNNSGKLDRNANGLTINELSRPGLNGAGEIISGALEMSNVDLSEEFTEMIVAQRGFQANTRIITTSDEILQELVNLKK